MKPQPRRLTVCSHKGCKDMKFGQSGYCRPHRDEVVRKYQHSAHGKARRRAYMSTYYFEHIDEHRTRERMRWRAKREAQGFTVKPYKD